MNKKHKVVYYVRLVVVSVLFAFSGITKLLGQPMSAAGFAMVGLPIWFMYVIGVGEILGVIGLWIRPLFRFAYEGLFAVLAGAFGTTLVFLGFGMSLFPLIVAIILAIVVHLHNKVLLRHQ